MHIFFANNWAWVSSQLLISSHTSQQEKMCGQGKLVNLASINLQLGTKEAN